MRGAIIIAIFEKQESMKKTIVLAAMTAACVAPQAFAQSRNFEGLSLGLSANFNNAKTEFPGQAPTDTSTTAGIHARYGWALGANLNLSLSASYDMGDVKSGTASGVTGVGKDVTVLSVDPGFKLSPDLLLYARLGYASVKGVTSGALVSSETYSGTAAGLGVRSMLSKTWSAQVEALQLTYAGKYSVAASGDVKPSASVIALGVNYHF